MNITYNGLNNPSGIITFSDVPNILKITEDDSGIKTTVTLTVNSTLYGATTTDGQWKISFVGDTISNVVDPAGAINKLFVVMQTPSDTAYSIARALRNCPTVSANYVVMADGNRVIITSKITGKIIHGRWSSLFQTNIPWEHFTWAYQDGLTNAQLYQSKIDVDIYSDGVYITTLEKNYYNGECAFNLSPVLTTFSKIGSAVPYSFEVRSVGGLDREGVISLLGTISGNYASVGYMVNQGAKYLDNTILNIAQNMSRGESREFYNNMLLYIYEPVLPLSFYRGSNGGGNITIYYKDSAFNTFNTQTVTWSSAGSSNLLIDLNIQLQQSMLNQAFYIDVVIGGNTIRYNVIRPVTMTEYSQRIYWRNSYGGVSFFDFTGQRSEAREFELSTYQKSIYDYYDDPRNELEKIYDNDVKYSVTLKSHLFENDGKYIFNDIIQSSDVWTVINGETYSIILDSVSVDEVNQNDIYEATVKYHYSMEPSII